MEPSSPKPDCVLGLFIVSAEITTDSASGQERDLGFSGWKNELYPYPSCYPHSLSRQVTEVREILCQTNLKTPYLHSTGVKEKNTYLQGGWEVVVGLHGAKATASIKSLN